MACFTSLIEVGKTTVRKAWRDIEWQRGPIKSVEGKHTRRDVLRTSNLPRVARQLLTVVTYEYTCSNMFKFWLIYILEFILVLHMLRRSVKAPYSTRDIPCGMASPPLLRPSPLDVSNIVNTSLPGLARLQAVELGDVAGLDGEVVLPGVLGGEVLGAEDLGGPCVPHGGVGQGLGPVDGDARVAIVVEHDGCNLCRAVNAVGLAGDSERIRGLGDDGVVLRLVLVGGALEAGDGCCVDVLCWVCQYF